MIDDGDGGAISGMSLAEETKVLGENLPQRHHKSPGCTDLHKGFTD
jgi:hypothetical protein